MRNTRKSFEKIGSTTFELAALALFVLGVLWPQYAEHVFKNQTFIFLVAVWCGITGFMLNSEFLKGFMAAVKEFRKASRDVWDDFDKF